MVTAKIELLLNMVWCFVVYCVQLPLCWIFCLPWLFQSFCLSQSIRVIDFQYWSCKSQVSVLDIKVLVLVLALNKQVLNPSLACSFHSPADTVKTVITNKWKVIKKLSYHRDSAGRRSLRCSGSFKVTDFCTNQLRSQRPNKTNDRAGSKTLFLLHLQTYETYNLKFHVNFFFTIFANLPPPSKCRLVRPAPPRYASEWCQFDCWVNAHSRWQM